MRGPERNLIAAEVVWARITPGGARLLADWVQMLQSELKAVQLSLDDAMLLNLVALEIRGSEHPLVAAEVVWARTTPGGARLLAEWVQMLQSELKAGQLSLDDATLRHLAETSLTQKGGSFVQIHQLPQVRLQSSHDRG